LTQPASRYYLAQVLITVGITNKRTQNIINLALTVRSTLDGSRLPYHT